MGCHEIQEQLSAFIDLEVGEELRRQITSHLAGCPACRAELEALERLEAALAGLEAPVPQGLAEKVRGRLPRPAASWRQSLALAACLALGIFLGGTLTGSLYPTPTALNSNGNGNGVASLEVFQDFPQGSLGTAVSYSQDEDSGA